jgi:hypothetical protein
VQQKLVASCPHTLPDLLGCCERRFGPTCHGGR